jgi:hypothetical protein
LQQRKHIFAVGVAAIWLAAFVAAQTQPGVDMGSKAHIQGSVVMLAHIGKDGAIENLYVEEGNLGNGCVGSSLKLAIQTVPAEWATDCS